MLQTIKRSEVVAFRVSNDERREIYKLAEFMKLPVSDMIRRLLSKEAEKCQMKN